MEKVLIDQDSLAAFKNEGSETAAGQSGESQDSQNFDDRATAALRGIDKSLKWLIDKGDRKLKEAGGDGIGSGGDVDDYHELWMINIEDWAKELQNDEFLKKSPRIMLGIVTAGILGFNGYDIYQKHQKKNVPDDSKENAAGSSARNGSGE